MAEAAQISIRGGSGLGDALYLQAIARHLVAHGEALEVCSDWPSVFLPLMGRPDALRPLAGRITVSPFRRDRIDRVAHYTARKGKPGTDQFQDCCLRADIPGPVELRLEWDVTNKALYARVRDTSWPIIVVSLPREPMGRGDGFAAELLPDCNVIQSAIDRLRGDGAFIVQIGKGERLHSFTGIDLDLANATSVAEMIDVVRAADGVLGFCSFLVPLAESLGKPGLFVWARRGLRSKEEAIRTITPQKVLHRVTSRFVIDDCSQDELAGAVDALCDAL